MDVHDDASGIKVMSLDVADGRDRLVSYTRGPWEALFDLPSRDWTPSIAARLNKRARRVKAFMDEDVQLAMPAAAVAPLVVGTPAAPMAAKPPSAPMMVSVTGGAAKPVTQPAVLQATATAAEK